MLEPVILAAGLGTRLGGDKPKCLLEVDGLPLLAHAFRSLAEAGFERVKVVVGHQQQTILTWASSHAAPLEVSFLPNPRYREPSIASLQSAILALDSPLLVLEGDTLFPASLPLALRLDPRPNLVAVGPPRQLRPWMVRHVEGRVLDWGYELEGGQDELIGMYKLSRESARRLLDFRGCEFWDPMLDLQLECLRRLEAWDEIDTPADLARVLAGPCRL